MPSIQEIFEFLSQYPTWVKVTVPCLVLVAFLLLVLFRQPKQPEKPPGNGAPITSSEVPVGNELVIDLSKGQDAWYGLTAWAQSFAYPMRELRKPFHAGSFPDWAPGVLIFALPKNTKLPEEEVASIKSWVERGGGLLVLGYYAADTHHGGNPSRLLREWGVSFEEDLLLPIGSDENDAREHVFSVERRFGVAVSPGGSSRAPIGAVSSLLVLSSASLNTQHASVPLELVVRTSATTQRWKPTGPFSPDGMRPLITRWVPDTAKELPIVVAFTAGRGRVAALGSWKIATLDYADNRQMVANLINWLRPRR